MIRPSQESDRPQTEKLFEDFMDYFIELDPLKRCRREPGYGQHIVAKTIKDNLEEGLFAVAELEGKLIGLVAGRVKRQSPEDLLDNIPSVVGWITELYVSPDHRGTGTGKLLMIYIEDFFRQKACDAIHLEVFVPNLLARHFYEKAGYHERDIELFKVLK